VCDPLATHSLLMPCIVPCVGLHVIQLTSWLTRWPGLLDAPSIPHEEGRFHGLPTAESSWNSKPRCGPKP